MMKQCINWINFFQARLSRRITFYVFISLILVEAVILVPSYYRRKHEQIQQLKEISAAAVTTVELMKLKGTPDEIIWQTIANLDKVEAVILGGAIYRNDGVLLKSFGVAPALSYNEVMGQSYQKSYQQDQQYRYDAARRVLDDRYILIVTHNATAIQRDLWAYVARITGLIIIIAAVVTLTTLLVLNQVALRPILSLRDDLLVARSTIGQATIVPEFQSTKTLSADELGDVITAFYQLYQRVVTEIGDREQAEANLRKTLQRKNLLNRLTAQIRDTLDLETILETAVVAIRELLHVERCHFIWFRPGLDQVTGVNTEPMLRVVKESKPDAQPSWLGHHPFHCAPDLLQQAAQWLHQLQVHCCNNVAELTDPQLVAQFQHLGVQAFLDVPLQTRSGRIGIVQCVQSSQPRPWINTEVELIQNVTAQLAIAISQAELYESTRASQEKAESLLLNILPGAIAERLKQSPGVIAERFEQATILFADLVNFTNLAAQIPAFDLVCQLNEIFSNFDRLTEHYGLEKIKTIGDAYMVVGGLPTPRSDHADAVAALALDMQQTIQKFQRLDGRPFELRIGIHTGPVVAGVIGLKKFIYDLWGDTVNIASRMESHGIPGKIQITQATHDCLKQHYQIEERGRIMVKGRGEMVTYWLLSHALSQQSALVNG